MTSTTPLSCEGFAGALADYLERDDSPRVRAAVETHAASCAECGALLADLQQLGVDASGLPTLSPSRDLWAGIAERIEAPVLDLGVARGARSAPGARSAVRGARWLRPVAAAAALVAMTAGVTYYVTREALLPQTQVAARPIDSSAIDPRRTATAAYDSALRAENVGTRVARADQSDLAPRTTDRAPVSPPRTSDRASASLAANRAAISDIETVYGREIARLRQIIDQRRGTLDTATVGVIERNLVIIDQAIRESRAALARDPASALLNEQLNTALERKVELLRAAVLLPART
jgi:hypothetical protein